MSESKENEIFMDLGFSIIIKNLHVKENDVTACEVQEDSAQAEEPHDKSHPGTCTTTTTFQPRRDEKT